jgi:hypothetical protein
MKNHKNKINRDKGMNDTKRKIAFLSQHIQQLNDEANYLNIKKYSNSNNKKSSAKNRYINLKNVNSQRNINNIFSDELYEQKNFNDNNIYNNYSHKINNNYNNQRYKNIDDYKK